MAKVRYPELDALRGLAALMMVLFYLTTGREGAFHEASLAGITAIDLFFMLSGFVIYMTLGSISGVRDFVVRRVARLYPAYWAAVILTFILLSFVALTLGGGMSGLHWIQFFSNLTMFQFYMGVPNLDASYWTLTVEVLFYVVMIVLYRYGRLQVFPAAGMLVSALCVTGIYFDVEAARFLVKWVPLLQFLPLFVAGTVFYRIHARRTAGAAPPDSAPENKPHGHINPGTLVNAASLICCYLLQLALFEVAGISATYVAFPHYAILLFVYFLLFVGFLFGRLQWIAFRPLLFFGKISYALYLVLPFLSSKLLIPFFELQLKLPYAVAAYALTFPLVTATAAAITWGIEIPAGKAIRRRFGAPPVRKSAPLQH